MTTHGLFEERPMKNLAKVPIGTAHKPRQNHITPEGAMIQSVYLRSCKQEQIRRFNRYALVCGVISVVMLVALLGLSV